MKAKKHLNSYVNFSIVVFIQTFIITGIVWIISKLILSVKMLIWFVLDHTEWGKERELTKAIEYFKEHGVQCPKCGQYIPRELQCCLCNHVLIDNISDNMRRILESK